MSSNRKPMLGACAFALLLAGSVSANAAQQRQTNQVSTKVSRTYAETASNSRTNARAAEDFQDRFTIDY